MSEPICRQCRAVIPAGSPSGKCPSCGASQLAVAKPVRATPVAAAPATPPATLTVVRPVATQPAEPSSFAAQAFAGLPSPPKQVEAFATTPYHSTSGTSVLSGVLMLGVGLVAAVIVGFSASLIGSFVYLVLIFPMLFGAAVGYAMYLMAKITKMHSPIIAFVLGAVCGFVTMFVMHYTDYLVYAETLNDPSPQDLRARELGVPFRKSAPKPIPSFFGYFGELATKGVYVGTPAVGFNLGTTGSYVYWILELLFVAVVVGSLASLQAEAPFCSECNIWKTKRDYGPFRGESELAKGLVEAGEVAMLGQRSSKVRSEPDLLLRVAACPHCDTDGPIDGELLQVKEKKDGKSETHICRVTYPRQALVVIQEMSES